MKPKPETYNPSPDYLRSLIEGAGLSQRAAARAIGLSERTIRYYLSGQREAPYTVQFALECLTQSPATKPR